MRKLVGVLGLFLAALLAGTAFAQPLELVERRRFSQMELDQMLAPIALYPDALLSQILMAATYPRDVFEAASWSRVNRVSGQEAVRAVEQERWDMSVISLAAFPHVLQMMDERREWTERLGDAFLAQPEQVMDTVQELRRRAYDAGHLRSTTELYVERAGRDFLIESPPEEVYVPYYDPRVVYGRWWWPGYDPVYWGPWHGYSYAPRWGFGWGSSVFVGSSFWYGGFDWRHRYVHYSHHRPWYWRHGDWRNGHRWTHNREHRHWRDRDGRPDWRDRRDHRDPRWRDRDGDGRPDRRDGRDGRGGRGQAPSGGALGGAAQVQNPGPFPHVSAPQAAPAPRGQYVQPGPQPFGSARSMSSSSVAPVPQPRAMPLPQQVAPVPQVRAAPAPQHHMAPASQQRVAPAPQPRPAQQPAERASPAPAERSAAVPSEPLGGAARFRDR